MTPERWKRIEEVFDRAIELAEPERSELVARACGTDAELQDEVRSLLASASGASASLQRAVGAAAERFASHTVWFAGPRARADSPGRAPPRGRGARRRRVRGRRLNRTIPQRD